MRFLGANVALTPRALKGFDTYQKAVELAEANCRFLPPVRNVGQCNHPREHNGAKSSPTSTITGSIILSPATTPVAP
jgi:hypothetical protein